MTCINEFSSTNSLLKENFTPLKVISKKEVSSTSLFDDKNKEELMNSTSTYFCSNSKDDKEVSDFKFMESTNSQLEISSFDAVLYPLKNVRFYKKKDADQNLLVVPNNQLIDIIKQLLTIILENYNIGNNNITINCFKIDGSFKVYYQKQTNSENENEDTIENNGYLSPETILGDNTHSSKRDVWAIGCILLTIILGTNPFATESSILTLFKIFKYFGTPCLEHAESLTKLCYYSPEFPIFSPKNSLTAIEEIYEMNFIDKNKIPNEITLLISKMLKLEAEERINIKDCLSFL